MNLTELYEGNNYDKYTESKNSYLEEDYESIHIMRCPNCGRKMNRYVEHYEAWGQDVTQEFWECPNGCNEDEY